MRICQHDALVNIIYTALSHDHPGVFKEHRASHDNTGMSHLSDVFHPDFQDDCSAFFDISVRSNTSFLYQLHVLG